MNGYSAKDTNARNLIQGKIHCVLWLREFHDSVWFESDIEGSYSHRLREGRDLSKLYDFEIREG